MDRQNKFERKLPDDRRRILIEATLKCLSEEGWEGLSVRKISAAAGISIGLINHHYESKEQLVVQAYESLTMSLLDVARDAVETAGSGAREQVSAMIGSLLAAPMFDPGTLRCWLVFWGMMKKGNVFRDVHDRTYGEYRTFVEDLLSRLATERAVPLLDVRLAAIGLLALIDGLWIEWCLNDETFSNAEAVRLCETWIDSLILRTTPGRV
ncbi:TetR family transcriptional regulator C-terminal domain-containing protein [Phyllobacterium sp. UNC302MFCol5.2]|uniref:TetR family transcriptional regulator C-terminal domain-containing protein n=1 Tax=Phyllobacterium sp. UNC302MFCol5.2 TaxID=1449065 RepID=UPI00048915DD|nr:TetR family transcriptional regulator C-terminal domain-containing protein [Phyllobacterium sp. UNC302MFCol5.2]